MLDSFIRSPRIIWSQLADSEFDMINCKEGCHHSHQFRPYQQYPCRIPTVELSGSLVMSLRFIVWFKSRNKCFLREAVFGICRGERDVHNQVSVASGPGLIDVLYMMCVLPSWYRIGTTTTISIFRQNSASLSVGSAGGEQVEVVLQAPIFSLRAEATALLWLCKNALSFSPSFIHTNLCCFDEICIVRIVSNSPAHCADSTPTLLTQSQLLLLTPTLFNYSRLPIFLEVNPEKSYICLSKIQGIPMNHLSLQRIPIFHWVLSPAHPNPSLHALSSDKIPRYSWNKTGANQWELNPAGTAHVFKLVLARVSVSCMVEANFNATQVSSISYYYSGISANKHLFMRRIQPFY
ncbi:unnamed protein product [Protopolystoma xenopodis]|uniref:Uncharacterized protein n=1 Tax=Protopolystoma xenopodis TaxID=117903 RepID=A0A448WCA3_9PLAT|nr:unnamed protein product [Protopolystoma xenopodis]